MTGLKPESYYARVVDQFERRELAKALIRSGHNRTYAARELGVSRRTLLLHVSKYDLRSRASVIDAAVENEDAIMQRVGRVPQAFGKETAA